MRLLLVGLLCPFLPQAEPNPAEPQVVVHSFRNAFGRQLVSEWQTWVLELENRLGQDAELTVRVEDPSAHLRVSRRESLPRGARKRLFFYLPTGYFATAFGSQPKYEILDSGGRKLKEAVSSEGLAVADANALQVGLFSKDLSSVNTFSLPQDLTGRTPLVVARLTPPLFPGRWAALAGLDAIIVHDAPFDELSADQAQALVDYVHAGGSVFLSPGPDGSALSHKITKSFCSIGAARSERRTEMPALTSTFGGFRGTESFFFHRIEGGQPLFKDHEVALFPSGFGKVIVLPFDIRRPPFDTWPGLEKLWLNLLSQIPRRANPETRVALPGATPEQRMNLFQSIALLINPYPSFLLLIALAAVFIVAVGPLNYLFLRRMGMTLLIVVTVPVISMGFLGLVLGIGYLVKGTSTVVYSARFLSGRSGLGWARETQLYTLFSPSTRSYEITTAPGTYGLPLGRSGVPGGRTYRRDDSDASPLECVDGASFAYTSVGVGQWQSWNLEAHSLRPLGQGVRFESAGDVLRIANLSPLAIERGLYLEAGDGSATAVPFGEIAPGKTVEVPLLRSRARPFEDLGLTRESFAGRMLGPTLDPFAVARPLQSIMNRGRPSLLCLLKDDDSPVKADARLSRESRSLTVLTVAEREEP